MLLEEGDVVKQGTYEEINETGFNIKEILQTYNQAMKNTDAEKKGKKFNDEAA